MELSLGFHLLCDPRLVPSTRRHRGEYLGLLSSAASPWGGERRQVRPPPPLPLEQKSEPRMWWEERRCSVWWAFGLWPFLLRTRTPQVFPSESVGSRGLRSIQLHVIENPFTGQGGVHREFLEAAACKWKQIQLPQKVTSISQIRKLCSERLSDLPRLTQLGSGRAGIRTHLV